MKKHINNAGAFFFSSGTTGHGGLARWSRLLACHLFVLLVVGGLCACSGPHQRSDAWKLSEIKARYARVRVAHPDAEDISVAEAMELDHQGRALFVDERTPTERAVSTLPGAVDVSTFLADPSMAGEREVIVFCTIGERSARRVEELRHQGIPARNLAGSILAWTHAGGQLIDGAGKPTKRVHVYGRDWDLAASGYEAVW